MNVDPKNLTENYNRIAAEAKELAGHSVKVIAVTKTFGPEIIEAALQANIEFVGENRIQEAIEKQDYLTTETSLGPAAEKIQWHLIGPVQSNKCKLLPGRFSLCHGLGSVKALRKLNSASAEQRLNTNILLQLNLTGEEQKAGFLKSELEGVLERVTDFKSLNVHGFMTMGPTNRDARWTEEVFKECAEIRDEATRRFKLSLPELSMGMSGDYQIACRAGATMIRVGTVLFGPRPA